MTIAIDSRENKPLNFGPDIPVETVRIPTFDYALAGDIWDFSVERKSLDDFVSSLAIKSKWERELAKIHRAKIAGIRPIIYVVEANFTDLETYPYKDVFSSGRVHKDFLYHQWRELSYTHGVHVVWAGNKDHAAKAVKLLLKSRKEAMAESLDMSMEHAKHSPSSLRYKEICPGWIKDSAQNTTLAEIGRLQHLAAQTGDFSSLTQDQAAAVNSCLEYVQGLISFDSKIFREIKLDIDGLTFGTADLVVVDEANKFVDVIDYKFGKLPIEDAQTNLQGWSYVLGAMQRFGAIKARMTFIMPYQQVVSCHEFTEDDIPTIRRRIATVIDRAEQCKADDLNPSDPVLCSRCGAAGWCTALSKKNLKSLAKIGYELPAALDPGQITEPEHFTAVLDIIPAIEHWIVKLKEMAVEMAKSGRPIPGYRLVKTKGHRRIAKPKELWLVLDEFYHGQISIDDFIGCCSVSIADLDIVMKKTCSKTLADEKFKEFVKISPEMAFLKKEQHQKTGK